MFEIFKTKFTDAHEAVRQVGVGRAALLDVRSPHEFAAGHAAGAQNLPLEAIAGGRLPQLPPGATIYVYCRSGSRSSRAAAMLTQAGFTAVHNIGGLHHWSAAGGTVE